MERHLHEGIRDDLSGGDCEYGGAGECGSP